jgi:hypothetical protein
MEFWNQLIIVLTLHCLADYPLQGEFLSSIKGKNFFLLLVHSFIWAGMVYGGFYFLGVTQDPLQFLTLFFFHAAIDDWKCKRKDKTKALTTDLYIDQFGHFLQIMWVFLVAWLEGKI